MTVGEYNEVYYSAFGEYFPVMLFMGMEENEIIKMMQKAVEEGKPFDTEKADEEIPTGTVI